MDRDLPCLSTMTARAMHFSRPPSAIAYMAGAFLPRAKRSTQAIPPLRATWSPATITPGVFADFTRSTGLRDQTTLSVLFPQTWGFRLQMAVLTSRAFPLPIWNALQVRNHLLLHRPIAPSETLCLETRVAGQRALDKGLEVDLHTTVRSGGELRWEGLTTCFYRQRMRGNDIPSPLASSPAVPDDELARWSGSSRGAWRFGRLTGDFNGVHWSDAYARRFGFAGAFHHPQRVIGQALARMDISRNAPAQRLDVWLKGPVFYDREIVLHGATSADTAQFALAHTGEKRSAIVGQWRAVERGGKLVDQDDAPCSMFAAS